MMHWKCCLGVHKWVAAVTRSDDRTVLFDWNWCERHDCKYSTPAVVNIELLRNLQKKVTP